MQFSRIAAAATFIALLGLGAAEATPTYIGNWEVDSGPSYYPQSLAYTGQEAAALLFGGTASDYVISTVDSNAADINDMAWYSVLGVLGPHDGAYEFAQDYVSSASSQAPGYYDSGNSFSGQSTDAASAYVADNATNGNVNFAFRIDATTTSAPEPITLSIFGAGLVGAAAMRRRKAKNA
jgi:PEP-CTERM motif